VQRVRQGKGPPRGRGGNWDFNRKNFREREQKSLRGLHNQAGRRDGWKGTGNRRRLAAQDPNRGSRATHSWKTWKLPERPLRGCCASERVRGSSGTEEDRSYGGKVSTPRQSRDGWSFVLTHKALGKNQHWCDPFRSGLKRGSVGIVFFRSRTRRGLPTHRNLPLA